MCSYGHINSTEVAVLCLLQKIMNDYAWSSKITREIHARANISSLPPKLVLYYTVPRITSSHHTQHSGPHSPSQKITKY